MYTTENDILSKHCCVLDFQTANHYYTVSVVTYGKIQMWASIIES